MTNQEAAIQLFIQRLVEYEQNIDVVPAKLRSVVKQRLSELGFELAADGYIDWSKVK